MRPASNAQVASDVHSTRATACLNYRSDCGRGAGYPPIPALHSDPCHSATVRFNDRHSDFWVVQRPSRFAEVRPVTPQVGNPYAVAMHGPNCTLLTAHISCFTRGRGPTQTARVITIRLMRPTDAAPGIVIREHCSRNSPFLTRPNSKSTIDSPTLRPATAKGQGFQCSAPHAPGKILRGPSSASNAVTVWRSGAVTAAQNCRLVPASVSPAANLSASPLHRRTSLRPQDIFRPI